MGDSSVLSRTVADFPSGRRPVSEITYTSLILGLLKSHRDNNVQEHLTEALKVVQRMYDKGTSLNRIGYNAIIRGLLEHGSPQAAQAAVKLFDIYREERRRNSSKVHYSTYIILLEKLLWRRTPLDLRTAQHYAQQAKDEEILGSGYYHRLIGKVLAKTAPS